MGRFLMILWTVIFITACSNFLLDYDDGENSLLIQADMPETACEPTSVNKGDVPSCEDILQKEESN